MRRAAPALVTVALLGAAAGCSAVGPDYETPETQVPAAWSGPAGGGLAADPAELEGWWRKLDDPVLDDLVLRARDGGLDLQTALARVAESRALLAVAGADRLPTIDATGAWEHRAESVNTPVGEFFPDFGQYSVGFDAAWEIDLWGRVRRSIEAAGADYQASLEDARDVAITVAAETAVAYVDLRAFQRRTEIARTNLELQQQTLDLVRTRFEAGLVSESDLAQARTSVETTRSRVPSFEAGVSASRNRLCVLLGLPPGSLAPELEAAAPIPVPPDDVAVGVPADLLRRRPDVRRAERELAAATARIGVAQADLYPHLTLVGSLGLAAEHGSDLFANGSDTSRYGPTARWNLFDSGRLRERVNAQDARAEQARLGWEQTVLSALEEAENAMSDFVFEQERRAALSEAVAQARRAVELARTQYTEGLADFQTVLVAERALADLDDQLAVSDAAITTDLVTLYKALGGGWEADDPVASAEAAAGEG
jgi:NodT family efflux transporter outer membrane factor (OMF) lipoprotein